MDRSRFWALVPIKRFAAAKQRLAPVLDRRERAALARAMLDDLLALLGRDPGLAGVLVVGEEMDARGICRRHGATFLTSFDARGLNAAVAVGAQALCRCGAAGMLVIPSDLPRLQLSDLDALRRALGSGDVALVAAGRDGGTNLMACRLPARIAPAYGPDSFARHRAAARTAGLAVAEPDCPGARYDLDRPEDLEDLRTGFLAEGRGGARTRAVLARLGGADAPPFGEGRTPSACSSTPVAG